jgi:hypothetical protein
MDTEWLNASAEDHKKEGLEWVKKAEDKFWFAKKNMAAADEALVFLKATESDKLLPKRAYKKADDWYAKVKEDFDLIKTKMWFVNEKKKTFQSSGGSKSDMRKAKNNAKSDYNYIEKHEKQLKNKKDRLEGERSFLGKIWKSFKTIGLSIPRTFWNFAARNNIIGIATAMKDLEANDNINYQKTLKRWEQFGGSKDSFQKNIDKGNKGA